MLFKSLRGRERGREKEEEEEGGENDEESNAKCIEEICAKNIRKKTAIDCFYVASKSLHSNK